MKINEFTQLNETADSRYRVISEYAVTGDDDGNDPEEMLRRFAKIWYVATDANTERRVEQALAKMGWEIGELESEEGGAFVVQAGDINGDSYIGFTASDLENE